MAPGEIPASLLATGRGIASAVVVRAQPPTALLSVRLALSFPITSRRSASAGWSLGKVFATRLPTAALRPAGWGSPSWVAGPRSGWSCYFMGRFLLLVNRCSRCARHRRPFLGHPGRERLQRNPPSAFRGPACVPAALTFRLISSWPVPELAWGSNLLLALCRCRDRSARFPSM